MARHWNNNFPLLKDNLDLVVRIIASTQHFNSQVLQYLNRAAVENSAYSVRYVS